MIEATGIGFLIEPTIHFEELERLGLIAFAILAGATFLIWFLRLRATDARAIDIKIGGGRPRDSGTQPTPRRRERRGARPSA